MSIGPNEKINVLVRYRAKADRRKAKVKRLYADYGDKFFDYVDYDVRPNDLVSGRSKLDVSDPRLVRVTPLDLKDKFEITTNFENMKKILDGLGAKYQCQNMQSTLDNLEQSKSHFIVYVRDFFDMLRHFDDEMMSDWYEVLYKVYRLYALKKFNVPADTLVRI